MNSNIISYSLSLLEIGLLSGCVWGFSFLQYIFEQELLFYDDLCLQDCLTACNGNSTCEYDCNNPEFVCTEVMGGYSLIFAIFRKDYNYCNHGTRSLKLLF